MQTEMLPIFVTVNLLGVAGIVVWHLQGHSQPTARLVIQIVFFLAMTAAVMLAGRNPFQYEAPHMGGSGSLVVTAKILWWTHLAWAAIGFVRIYIVLDGRPKEARLLQDLIVALVYLGVLLSIMAFVFGAPIGTLLATSGIVAIILGLALQNTLGDVFSGIALTLGRPYVIGDWILLPEGTEGRVVASNWRSTYLLTPSHNLLVLPNSVLAKQGVTNVSKPNESHQISLTVHVRPEHQPSVIREIMQTVLDGCNSVIHNPQPAVALRAINAAYIEVDLLFHVPEPSKRNAIRNEVIDMVFRHCRANGIGLAMPSNSSYLLSAPAEEPNRDEKSGTRFLAELCLDQNAALSATSSVRTFRQGDLVASKGSEIDGLWVIRTGVAQVVRGDQVTRLSPGDVLAGASFLSEETSFDVRALTSVTIDEISKETLESLMKTFPDLQDRIAKRLKLEESKGVTQLSTEAQPTNPRPDLTRTIRALFKRDTAQVG